MAQSKGSTRFSASLPVNGNKSQLPKHIASLKKLTMGKVPKKKTMSVNVSHALFFWIT
jgi:hypothetical protein